MWILKKSEPFLDRHACDTVTILCPPAKQWPIWKGRLETYSLPGRRVPIANLSRILAPVQPVAAPLEFCAAVPEPLDARHGLRLTLCFSQRMGGLLVTNLEAHYGRERALELVVHLTGHLVPERAEV